MTKPLYFYNGTTFELVGPTTPQSPIAYQTSAPTAPATGDLWIDSDGDVDTYNRQLTRYYYVATASQTTITGIDANGLTLAYVAGSEAVYVNGALQVRGQDYTATNGTSVVMSSGLAVNDVVEIFAYTAFTVANAYTKSETDGVAAAAAGLRMVVPSSISVGSGSGSVDATGNITFSGTSSININGCFTSLYDNYRIILSEIVFSSSSIVDASMGLRASGSNATGNNYIRQMQRIYGTGSAAPEGGTSTAWYLGAQSTGGSDALYILDIANPFLSKTTSLLFNVHNYQSDIATYIWKSGGGVHNVTSSYDGFSFAPGGGTITGKIRIYGYKD